MRPDQIKQSRQNILSLAVRGKLLAQESLSEVLDKKYAEEPRSDALPETWRLLNFGKYCDIEGGNQPPKSQFISNPKAGYVRLLQIRDLGAQPVPTFIPIESTNRFCKEGEILIGRYGASVGKVFWAEDGAYNVAMAKFIWPNDAFIATFAFLLLKSEYFQGALAGASRSAQAGFNKGDLAAINFPLPPLAEQYRIVAKVEELMALCDRLEANLAVADDTRQNLLDALVADALGTADREAA
jgi:type I restriction enzyme S subunit